MLVPSSNEAERDQRSLSSLVEKLLTEYCEKIGLIKPSK